MQTIGNPQEVSVYVHIPFCTKKCDYCHFYVLPNQEALKDPLKHCLELEWKFWQPQIKNRSITSIYFGGGTPSLFGAERVNRILELIRSKSCVDKNVEITLEANPENLSYILAREYQQAGVNRVSIGVQSLNDPLLKALSRTHSAKAAIDCIYETKRAGINNISIDLMYDIPHQTVKDWATTLEQVVQLPITHLSLYNLTIEPYTSFYKRKSEIESKIPKSEESTAMYLMAQNSLKDVGLNQYEISAFSKHNCYSRHNIGYWLGREFIGMGPSAFSYWKGKRFRNIPNFNKYQSYLLQSQSPIDFEEELDPSAQKRELLVLALRILEGCHLDSFEKKVGLLEKETKEILHQLVEQGYLQIQNQRICLTEKGILFYDDVAIRLI